MLVSATYNISQSANQAISRQGPPSLITQTTFQSWETLIQAHVADIGKACLKR